MVKLWMDLPNSPSIDALRVALDVPNGTPRPSPRNNLANASNDTHREIPVWATTRNLHCIRVRG